MRNDPEPEVKPSQTGFSIRHLYVLGALMAALLSVSALQIYISTCTNLAVEESMKLGKIHPSVRALELENRELRAEVDRLKEAMLAAQKARAEDGRRIAELEQAAQARASKSNLSEKKADATVGESSYRDGVRKRIERVMRLQLPQRI